MSKKIKKGLVHVYTGDGKGKTTAALGLAFRALGWGARVCMVQFIKGYPDIGEAHLAEDLGDRFVLKQFAVDPTRCIDEAEVIRRREQAEAAMSFAEQVISGGEYDVIILDEINNACHYGLVDVPRVISMIQARPAHVEVVLTGRNAPADIIEKADYVTELKLVKHPYQKGIQARKGIDY